MKENPENMYVDVGGSLDVFTKGKSNRLYTDLTHPFSKESCVFAKKVDSIVSPIGLEIVPIVITEAPVITKVPTEIPEVINEIIGGAKEAVDMLQLLLNYQTNFYKDNIIITPEMCKRYTFGNGYIQFSLGGVLHTSWKEGTYKFLDATTIQAKWSTNNHIIKMDDALDSYTAIHTETRVITTGIVEPEAVFIYEDCLTEAKAEEVLPSIVDATSQKYLIYACVFHKRGDVDLLKLLLTTYKCFARTTPIDFVVFTSAEFSTEIIEFGKTIDLEIRCQIFGFTTMHESSCARLFIFDYKDIHLYKKVLYLDTDIIIQGDLLRLFELDISDRVHVLAEGTIDHEIHGGWFFDFTKIDKKTPAINGGIMLFSTTDTIRSKFRAINAHIARMKARGGRMPECWDQPFLNYHLIKDSIQDTTLLKQYALIYCTPPLPPPSSPTDVSICHFVWPLGNAEHKRKRMETHVSHLLTNYQKIYPGQEVDERQLVGKTYTWNSGFIEFCPDGLLKTKWKGGKYFMLDANTVVVSWLSFCHIIKMDATLERYVGFRIGDLLPCSGFLFT
ncbi:MAG: glycosyltransferase, partial [bacterium]